MPIVEQFSRLAKIVRLLRWNSARTMNGMATRYEYLSSLSDSRTSRVTVDSEANNVVAHSSKNRQFRERVGLMYENNTGDC